MSVNRALLAALLHVAIVAVLTTNALFALGPALSTAVGAASGTSATEGVPVAIQTGIPPTSRILIGMIVAFIAGWWGTSGLTKRWPQQGLLIGVLIAIMSLALAAATDGLGTRSGWVVLDAVGAFIGAAFATSAAGIRRAFAAASIQFFVTIIVTLILAYLILAWLRDPGGEFSEADVATFRSYQPWLLLLVSATTAFLAAWWGTRGVSATAVRHGLLIGILAVGFFCTWIVILGGYPDWLFLLLIPPVVGAAIAGAVFARSRDAAQPV